MKARHGHASSTFGRGFASDGKRRVSQRDSPAKRRHAGGSPVQAVQAVQEQKLAPCRSLADLQSRHGFVDMGAWFRGTELDTFDVAFGPSVSVAMALGLVIDLRESEDTPQIDIPEADAHPDEPVWSGYSSVVMNNKSFVRVCSEVIQCLRWGRSAVMVDRPRSSLFICGEGSTAMAVTAGLLAMARGWGLVTPRPKQPEPIQYGDIQLYTGEHDTDPPDLSEVCCAAASVVEATHCVQNPDSHLRLSTKDLEKIISVCHLEVLLEQRTRQPDLNHLAALWWGSTDAPRLVPFLATHPLALPWTEPSGPQPLVLPGPSGTQVTYENPQTALQRIRRRLSPDRWAEQELWHMARVLVGKFVAPQPMAQARQRLLELERDELPVLHDFQDEFWGDGGNYLFFATRPAQESKDDSKTAAPARPSDPPYCARNHLGRLLAAVAAFLRATIRGATSVQQRRTLARQAVSDGVYQAVGPELWGLVDLAVAHAVDAPPSSPSIRSFPLTRA